LASETLRPHCPKCDGKPTAGQRKLTEHERDGATAVLRKRIKPRFDSTYVCQTCGAVYSYANGFSTYLGRL
jgi:hypothetical protein